MGQSCSRGIDTGRISNPGARTSTSKGDSGKKGPRNSKGEGKGGKTVRETDGLRRYEIIRRLGEGGFGVVHLVREKATGEEWAAKVLHATDDASKADGMSREDIRNECEILKMMHHPSICRLREHFERDKGAEVVMVLELLSGGDLLDSVIDNGTYNEADAREIFTQVLDGVAHMHERGVVHRDLKVENLMMKNPGDLTSVKIIDVGLAIKVIDGENKEKKIREVSEEDMIKGTPEYMAGPESRSPSVDVWALGCLLYILLGGYSPYADNDPRKTVRRVAKGQYHPFTTDEVWNSVSNEAKDVIMRCFEVTREKRITVDGLRAHPWLAMEKMGLTETSLEGTRTKLKENFRSKFRKAGNTIRATLRMQSLIKGLGTSSGSSLKSDSGDSNSKGEGQVETLKSESSMSSLHQSSMVFNSIEEAPEDEAKEDVGGITSPSSRKYVASSTTGTAAKE